MEGRRDSGHQRERPGPDRARGGATRPSDPGRGPLPRIIVIPSDSGAFREHVERLMEHGRFRTPDELEVRLRHLFPRVRVRARSLSAEPPAWYVYRDGGWRPSGGRPWWEDERIPRVVLNRDGWIAEANVPAQSLLRIGDPGEDPRHYTDFVLPGTVEDATALFEAALRGREAATVVLRPDGGEPIACDAYVYPDADRVVALFRHAEDLGGFDVAQPEDAGRGVALDCAPSEDVAFRAYAELLLARMAEPTPDGLALRLRRLYPHARVEPSEGRWLVRRDATDGEAHEDRWWLEPEVARVEYDAQGLIVDANSAATRLLGPSIVGHHWQELVTPADPEQVSTMIAIIGSAGEALSRFRMPGADGRLVEFDSHTTVSGESFTTVMRPIEVREGPVGT